MTGDGASDARGWRRALPARLRRGAVRAQVDEELAVHLEMREQEYAARGMSAEAARAEALRRMGDLERVRGTCRTLGEARERDMERTEYLDEIRSDLRFGLRQLLRSRGLTAVAVLTRWGSARRRRSSASWTPSSSARSRSTRRSA